MAKQKRAKDILKLLSAVPPPNPLRQAAARSSYLQEAARLRGELLRPKRAVGLPRSVHLRPLVIALLLAGLLLGGMSGTAYAADRARPGDLLYPLDRSLETLHLRLTRNPQRALALRLSYAEERLLEAEWLAAGSDEANLTMALDAYTQLILTLPPSPELDQRLARHELRLRQLWEQAPERARHGLERALDALAKERSGHPPKDGPSPSAPTAHPTPAAPQKEHHGPPQEPPGKATTKTPHRPEDAGPPQERGKSQSRGKD